MSGTIATRIANGTSCASAAARRARRAEKDGAECLDETRQRERPGEREGRHDEDEKEHRPAVRRPCDAREARDVQEPLAHETVERWKSGDGHGANEEGRGRPRHPSRQAAHAIDLARVGAVNRRTRAEEKERFEEAVVPDVEQRARVAEEREERLAVRLREDTDPEPGHDDADVLDAVIREQTLEVVLRERERHAENARRDPGQQQRRAERGRHGVKEREHAHEPVHAHFDRHAGHHGGDVTGRSRVSAGQPDVKGHEARLDAEGDEREAEQRVPYRKRACPDGERHERPRVRDGVEERDDREERERCHMARCNVDPRGAPALRLLVLGGDEKEGRHRHDLPRGKKENRVRGAHDQRQRSCHDSEERPDVSRAHSCGRPVAIGIETTRAGEQEDRGCEERGERIDANDQGAAGNVPRERESGGSTGETTGETEHRTDETRHAAGDDERRRCGAGTARSQ